MWQGRPQPAGILRVAASGEGRSFFVPDLDESEFFLVAAQSLEYSIDAIAGETKDSIDTSFDQTFHQ
jgi:hypothetical protein